MCVNIHIAQQRFKRTIPDEEQYRPIILDIEKGTFISISESRKNWPLLCKGQCSFLLHVPFCTPPVLFTTSFCHLGTMNPQCELCREDRWQKHSSETFFYVVAKRTSRSQANSSQRSFFFSMMSWLSLDAFAALPAVLMVTVKTGLQRCVLVRFRRVQQRCAPLLPGKRKFLFFSSHQ